ncbi:hypothetical protein [Streptosporangium sp. NPDC049078]|uniref:hypothetical protein n=1 Tax=Streptosporangium sp. NPDC049078 TaxID=3155767 RepID=UPI00343FA718
MPDESTSRDQARAEADALAAWQAIPYSVSPEEAQRISRAYLDEAREEFEEQTSRLSQADQDRTRQIEAQLNANGRQVYANARWWGFEIVLNAAAAQAAAEISELVGEIVAMAVRPRTLGRLIELSFQIRSLIIQIVGRDHGCRLVSPWFAPGMLLPISLAPRQDTSLWWTTMNTSHNWSENERFPGHLSRSNPALAEFRGRLYAVHRGDRDESLWWTAYDPGSNEGWSDNVPFPAHRSADGPALAVYNNFLYCVHRGGGNDRSLWWTRFDGNRWSPDTRMNGASSRGPALTTFNGMLYCAYRDANSDQMWWTRFNGTSWSNDQPFGSHFTASNPALAVYGGVLYCVFRGGGSDHFLWWTSFDGTRWSSARRLPAHRSAEGPALAVFNNRLYCVHRGSGDQSLWWTSFNSASWSPDIRLPGHLSAQGPAIVSYREPYGTEDQLFCVHRGHG